MIARMRLPVFYLLPAHNRAKVKKAARELPFSLESTINLLNNKLSPEMLVAHRYFNEVHSSGGVAQVEA
jgi:hypothetical protein